jgi:exopolysaccharide biosynthesis polyprenyl glycosylphosphotransferase
VVAAVNPLGGADLHDEGLDEGGREPTSAFTLEGADNGALVGLELAGAGAGELVVPTLGTPLAERFRAPVDVFRSRQAAALDVLRPASIVVFVFLLVSLRAESAAAAAAASLPISALWILCQRAGGRLIPRALGRLTPLIVGTAIGAVVISAAALWVGPLQVDLMLLAFMIVGVLALSICFEILTERSVGPTRVLVVGAGANAAQLAEDVGIDPEGRFEVVCVASETAEPLPGVRSTCAIEDISETLGRNSADLVVLAIERGRPQVFQQILEAAEAGFRVVGLPEFYEHAFGRVPVRHLSAAWFMSVLHLYQPAYTRFAKRFFDVVVVGLALILCAPLLISISLMIWASRGPIIFRQRRLGEHGREFTILKFRTMHDGAERPGEAVWAEKDDSRVTGFGRLLRQTRLDELPQLWNVLRGDMSIVGPRPERPEFLHRLSEEVPFWSRRHLLKPGITGWAQVHSGYAADSEMTAEKLSYDLWYLRHRSFLTDLVICAKTIRTLASGFGAR